MRINPLYTLVLVLALSTAGCTATWYDIMENGRVSQCERLHGQEREECLEQAKMSYEKYEQEREQALEKEGSD